MIVSIRVQPRAKRNRLAPGPDREWKLYLTAPPVEGKANRAAIDFFARNLSIPASRVRLLSGEKSRRKRVELMGVTEEQFLRLAEDETGR